MKNSTKIVCTLGPSSDSIKEISALIEAGMDMARLNFSHGSYPHHEKMIQNIHKAEIKTGETVTLMQDLQGPKIRLGELPKSGITLKKGDEIILTTKKLKGSKKGTKATLPVQYKEIGSDVKVNDSVLLRDGLIELKIKKVQKTKITCIAQNGGKIISRNGMNFPDTNISIPTITEKDRQDLIFGLEQHLDYVALSFVKSKKDIKDLRKLIKKQNPAKIPQIIAKIERHEALKNLKSIIKAADAVMVARGDLGVNTPLEEVPLVQQKITKIAKKYKKPIIVATQVLQSMVKNPRPTRAEVSDAANAIFDNTDYIMLSAESAIGKYPAKATQTLTKIITAIENENSRN